MPWHLKPNHHRDYRSAHDIKMDLLADKDFIIADISSPWDGKPVNLEQMKKGDKLIFVRYTKLTKVARIVLDDKLTFERVLTKIEKQVLVDLLNKRPHVCPVRRVEISLRDSGLVRVHHGNFSLTQLGERVARNVVGDAEGLAAS